MNHKKLISLRIISLLLSVLTAFCLFFMEVDDKGIVRLNSFSIITSLLVYIVMLAVAGVEAWKLEENKRTSIVRVVYLFICLFIGCVNINDGWSSVALALIVSSIPYAIIMLIAIILTMRNEKQSNSSSANKNTLPYMVLKPEERVRSNVALAVFATILIGVALILGLTGVGYTPLIYIAPSLFIVIFVTLIFLPKESKKLINASNNGDLKRFLELYDSIDMSIQDNRSIAYIQTLKANLLINDDPVAAEEIMKKVEPVKNIRNFQIAVLAMALSARGHYKEALQLAGDESQLSKRLELNHIIFDTTREVENIEGIFRIANQLRVVKLNSLFTLMVYYDKRGKKDLAKEYATLLVDEKSDFRRINNYAHNVLNK